MLLYHFLVSCLIDILRVGYFYPLTDWLTDWLNRYISDMPRSDLGADHILEVYKDNGENDHSSNPKKMTSTSDVPPQQRPQAQAQVTAQFSKASEAKKKSIGM